MDLYDLPNRDILHLNVILIAGILIFMTVSQYSQIGSFNEYRSIFQIVAFMIGCFSLSSILLIWTSFCKLEKGIVTNKNVRIGGAFTTVLGLVFLIIFGLQLAYS